MGGCWHMTLNVFFGVVMWSGGRMRMGLCEGGELGLATPVVCEARLEVVAKT